MTKAKAKATRKSRKIPTAKATSSSQAKVKTKKQTKSAASPSRAAASANKKKDSKNNNNGGGKSAGQVIIERMAEYHVRGVTVVPRKKLEAGGLKMKTVANNLTTFKKKGHVVFVAASESSEGAAVSFTPEGLEAYKDLLANMMPTGTADAHDRIKSTLKGKQVALFDLLADGKVHDRGFIAMKLGYSGADVKAYKNLLSTMSSKKIIHYPDKESIQLTEEMCFPFGRD